MRCFVKGAPDVLLARSDPLPRRGRLDRPRWATRRRRSSPPTTGWPPRASACSPSPAATSTRPRSTRRATSWRWSSDLELLALVGIVDPPRKEAKDAIALCKDAGIRVRMITGDHATTAAAIAHQLGIEGRALTGAEFAAMSDDQLNAEVDGIGVVARVAPEDKVRLVSILKGQGNIVAMTGDGVNDAPALTRADIGVAMGITGTEVTKDAAEMILTDDNFATIVTAVEGGRGLYDNLMKYVRVQMIMLAGFILLFVGAGIFTIADGTPLLPLQILWINFAVDVLLALGLGFDAPTPGLMKRRPRSPAEPVIAPALGVRLGIAGLLIAGGTLGVVAWAEDRYDLTVATTMGLTTISLLHIVAALEWRDPIRTVFTRDTVANGRFNLLVLAAFALTFLATTVPGLQRLLDTTGLDGDQWRVCLVAVIGYLVLAELAKVVLRRFHRTARLTPHRPPRRTTVDTHAQIVDELRVAPGTKANLAGRPCRWTRHRRLRRAVPRRAGRRREVRPAGRDRAARGRPGAAVGERLVRAADRVPGDGRRRQGLDDRARDVGREPAGRAGRVVQATVERGARPHVPLAHLQGGARARPHRDLQPVALRGGRRAPGPSGVARQAGAAGHRPGPAFWAGRYEDLNAFEQHLDRNGTKVVKFFLHVSKEEQKRRFMARLDNPDKLWKFNADDVVERARWDDYMRAYEDAITATSTEWAPWYVIPADHKRVMQAMVAAIIADTIDGLDLQWPTVDDDARRANEQARRALEAEPELVIAIDARDPERGGAS